MLDVDKLISLADQFQEEYRNNAPFPHIVIDDFLPLEIVEKICENFPSKEKMDPNTFQTDNNKIASRPNVDGFPETLKNVLYALNSHEIVTFLEVLTGINGLVGDPHYLGGGLHQTFRGGKLGIHVDFNYHKHLRLDRRINLLIFLNKNWKEEYGGHLELWNSDMTQCVKRILPKFNRCVIFNTTDSSYHGHPDPLTCPDSISRKSIALYYYSSGRPEDDAKEVFWTAHQNRPGTEDDFVVKSEGTLGKIFRNITPPIIYNTISKILSK